MLISDLIKEKAQTMPTRTAYVFRDHATSYLELEDKINRCAVGLKKIGVTKGSSFGIVLRNSPEFLILTMALSQLGGVVVPINFLEKPDRIALILKNAKAMGVLTAKEFYRSVATAVGLVSSVNKIFLRDGTYKEGLAFDSLLQSNPLAQERIDNESNLIFLLYTSGTTGQPKGVMLSHKNLLANMNQCLGAVHLTAKDRVLCLLPMFHSFAWTTCIMVPLKLGALIVINESLLPFDPVIKTIWKYKITVFVAVPQIYSALTAKIKGIKALLLRILSPIRLCISGAAPLPIPVHKRFHKLFGIPLVQGYGLTETSPVATLNPEKKPRLGTVGIPLPGVEIKICDEEGKEVPQGEVGEIWIKGENVMEGYFQNPEETNLILTPDHWLKSGDLARQDPDRHIVIVDRKKDLIIIKGLNVYPLEIENVIAAHPDVKEVAVIGKMEPDTGEEKIRAFITLQDNRKPEKGEIYSLCKKNLAAFKRPKDIIFLKEMPRNALQKILKKDLRQR